MRTYSLFFLIALFLFSCGESNKQQAIGEDQLRSMVVSPPATRSDVEKNEIIDYALKNKLEVQATPSGIFYTIEGEGEGTFYTPTSVATLHYTCKRLKDGFVTIDTRKGGAPFEYVERYNVAKGLAEAIGLLSVGQKGTFIVPSALGYGSQGAGNYYPPNTILIFEVEMLKLVDNKEKIERQNNIDQEAIEAYINRKNLKLEKTADGIHYKVEGGSGAPSGVDQKLKMKYSVTFLDDFEITNTSKMPGGYEEFTPASSMKYWAKITPLLKKGSKGKFIIPSGLAFGDKEVGQVPANSCLVIDCELIDF